MAISLQTGRTSPKQSIDKNYDLVKEFINAFEEKFSSTNCGRLLGVDLDTVEGQIDFIDNDKIELCCDYVEEATRIVLNLI